MSRKTTLGLFMLIVLGVLPGCYFAAGFDKAPRTKDQVKPIEPAIDGDWSEPVNGIRMMAKTLEPNPAMKGQRIVLLFAENVGDKPVELPTPRPVPFVSLKDAAYQGLNQSHENLWIQYERTDGLVEKIHDVISHHRDVLKEMSPMMAVGEVRVFALLIVIDPQRHEQLEQLQRVNEIPLKRVDWLIGVEDRVTYRLYLTYRPDGFTTLLREKQKYQTDWTDKQIDLPPIEIEVSPDGDGFRSEELNG